MIRITELKLPVSHEREALYKKAAKALRIRAEEIQDLVVFKRSLDARKKDNIHYVYVVDVVVANEKKILEKVGGRSVTLSPDFKYRFPEGQIQMDRRPVIVGFGPAGMFCGLLMAQMGMKPIIVERGAAVEARRVDVARFWKEGELNPESNVQFGEGGAGTFSDGKLTTRIKDPRCRKVLEEMVRAGAPEEILYDAKPHIGTDLLQPMVKRIREEIIRLGGEVRFSSRMDDIEVVDQTVRAITLNHGERIETDDLILALGHSARDTFELLHKTGFSLEQKPFAMGVRIEHSQAMINAAQYGESGSQLPAADYRLTHTTQKGRGVYTFCVCPGGYVVGAASEEGRLVVNGMSEYARGGENVNSALLVQVFPEDFGSNHPLAGMYLQRELEESAFAAGGKNYFAPVQTVGGFLKKEQKDGVCATYKPGITLCDLHEVLPRFMAEALEEAIPAMGKRLRGFDCEEALLSAVESRSSSPIRILRDKDGESTALKGVYPVGEGAGYAGGIVSAAVDGISAAEHIFMKYKK